jgi:hypothetical protein
MPVSLKVGKAQQAILNALHKMRFCDQIEGKRRANAHQYS